MHARPIGVFDSGVGGLTVVREIFRQLPEEEVVYLGDTARVPYGPRGVETVRDFALELSGFLIRRDVKALVIACNTVSAVAAQAIRDASPVPVFDVVTPTVLAATQATRSGIIGVIGTVGTIRSEIYARLAAEFRPDVRVIGQACPLFVPIAEEQLGRHAVAELMAAEYLAPIKAEQPDVLILGCTHYPLLREVIGRVMGPNTRLIDSAEPTVVELAGYLNAHSLCRVGPPQHRFFVTDASYKFLQIANSMLARNLEGLVEQVAVGG